MFQDDLPATWSEDSLLQSSPNFQPVPRISALEPCETIIAKISKHEESGVPLIIGDWDKRPDWDSARFSIQGFLEDPQTPITVRNVQTFLDVQMPLGELIDHYQLILEEKRVQDNAYYGKDLPCPKSWEQWLGDVLPRDCHPLGSHDMLSHLSTTEQPETLMCYIGIGETFTPAHKDPCGSFGHNIMCYASQDGSAFWFMSETGQLDEDKPSRYFRQQLHTDLDLESRKLTVQEFREAPFTVYCARQRLGDLVLVPPRSCHQVVNAGGITIKMSWSRMGLKSLEYSLLSELLLYHRICRPEVYRVKLTVLRVLQAYTLQLSEPSFDSSLPPTLSKIIDLFDAILIEEWSPKSESLPLMEPCDSDTPFGYTCDFCGADILQSLFVCADCSDSNGENGANTYMCCPSCYVEGRSCQCGPEHMQPYQVIRFQRLVDERNKAVLILKQHLQNPIPLDWSHDMKGPSHISIFHAARLQYNRVIESINSKRDYLHCSRHSDISHPVPPYSLLRCPPCHRGLCFSHTLQHRGIHSVEALLANQNGLDEWHERHKYRPDEDGYPPKSFQLYHGEHSRRLAKAALTSPDCRPIDFKRSKSGFYDEKVFIKTLTDTADDLHASGEQPNNEGSDQSRHPSINLKRIVGDEDSSLTPLSELEDDLPLGLYFGRLSRLKTPSLLTLSLLTSPNTEPPSFGLCEMVPSSICSTTGTIRPNFKKRLFVELPHLKDHTTSSLSKRPRRHDTSSGSLDPHCGPVTSASSRLTPITIPCKSKTVVPVSSISPFQFIDETQTPSKSQRPAPKKTNPVNKRKTITASTSTTPKSSILPSIYPCRFGVPTRKGGSGRKVGIPPETPTLAPPQHSSTPLSRTPISPIVSPFPHQPSKTNALANTIESLYQEVVQTLHPGDTLRHSKLIEEYRAASNPELFLVRQLRDLARKTQLSIHERDTFHAEARAVKLQMSFAAGVTDGQTTSKEQEDYLKLKQSYSAMKQENEELKERLKLYDKVVSPPQYQHQTRFVAGTSHNYPVNYGVFPNMTEPYQLTPPDPTRGPTWNWC